MPKSRQLFAPPNIYVLCTLYYLLIIKMYFIIICGERKIGGSEKGLGKEGQEERRRKRRKGGNVSIIWA